MTDLAQSEARLRIDHLSKSFPGTQALSDVSLQVGPGEIRALVGGNGSGKSTLIKILAGVQPADPGGQITVSGESIAAEDITPEWSFAAALAFVHQDLGLFEHLSVAENVFVGLPYPRRAGRIDWGKLNREAASILERLRVKVSPRVPLAGLRASDRTLVAIARAVRGRDGTHDGALVLDEPTARLAAPEADRLLDALRRFAVDGQTILYVSHRLDEVLAMADSIAVLRDGAVVADRSTDGLDAGELSRLIVGHTVVSTAEARADPTAGPLLLEVEDVWTGPLKGVDLTVAEGEIIGITGLIGAGTSSLLRAIYGAQDRRGVVRLGGRELCSGDIAAAARAGAALVPENRLREGAFVTLSVRENLSASYLTRFRHRLSWIDRRAEVQASTEAIRAYGVRCRSPEMPMALLSGGNQQKVVFARWLTGEPRLLLLDEPTQGVDVGARAEIHRQVRAAAKRGCGVIVASSDADELLELSDRVVVLRDGKVAVSAGRDEVDRHWLAQRVFGHDYLQESQR
jgi:ABC-type sugar transport system ATPase subunit